MHSHYDRQRAFEFIRPGSPKKRERKRIAHFFFKLQLPV
jgi:hypothetical protein